MSREFGDTIGGFFHDKLRYAVEDAESGTLTYTRAVGKVLQPLAEIAWHVSSVEAGDSSTEAVVSSILQHLPELRLAVDALAQSVYSHQRVADDAAYQAVKQFLPVPQWEDQKKKIVSLEVMRDALEVEQPLHVREQQERLFLRRVREFAQDWNLTRSSVTSNGNGKTIWRYSPWNEAGLLRKENQRLRAAVQRLVDYLGDCRLDHNGRCQEHGVSDPPCMVAQAKTALGII